MIQCNMKALLTVAIVRLTISSILENHFLEVEVFNCLTLEARTYLLLLGF